MKNLKHWFFCFAISIFFVFSCFASGKGYFVDGRSYFAGSKSMSALEPLKPAKAVHSRMNSFFEEGKKDVSANFRSHDALDSLSHSEYDDEDSDNDSSSDSESLCLSHLFELSMERPTKIILTVDGGGSRGIIPLFYIGELYKRLTRDLGEEVKLPIDMYAGTSVGAIIVTAIAMGKYDYIHERYSDIAKQIFSYKWWKWPFTKLFRGYTYESAGRAAAIKELVTSESETENTIESDLLIPFCSAKTNDIFKYRNYADVQEFSLFDALMSSSAAPTYFPPHVFKGLDGEHYEGTDGGIYANHPGKIALDDAFKRYPGARYIMISFGTGKASAAGTTTQGLSLIGWARKIADLCVNLQCKQTNDFLISMAGNRHSEDFRYIRINPTLDRDDYITDGVSESHLEHLTTIARQSIEQGGSEKRKFDEVVDILKTKLDY